MTEYLKIKGNEHLIGKKARFKQDLPGYCSHLWGQEGVIGQHKGLEHVGLSIFFPKPVKRPNSKYDLGMKSCYMVEGSFELLEAEA